MLQRDALITALKARGFVEVPAKTKRYVVMELNGDSLVKFFIGKSGGLRYGKSVTDSRALEGKPKEKLLKEGGY